MRCKTYTLAAATAPLGRRGGVNNNSQDYKSSNKFLEEKYINYTYCQ